MSSKSNEFEAQGEGLNPRRVGRVGEFYNINPNATSEGKVANLEEYTDRLLIHLYLPLEWLNEFLGRDELRDLRKRGQGLPSFCDSMVCLYQVNFPDGSPCLFLLFIL